MLVVQSSMPRSGSTLLQNILAQNPAIKSSPTSTLGELVGGARKIFRGSTTAKATGLSNVTPSFKEFVKGGVDSWHYAELRDSEASIYVDKSRSWLFEKQLLRDIYGDDFRIICMVRDMRDVVASMEKNHRKNIYRADHIEDGGGLDLTQRVNKYLSSIPIAPFLHKVQDVIQCDDMDNIIFVKYEALIANPSKVLEALYKALGIEPFEHDFDNIEQLTHEDDEWHGIYGQHKIRRKIENPSENGMYFNNSINKTINESAYTYQKFFGYITE